MSRKVNRVLVLNKTGPIALVPHIQQQLRSLDFKCTKIIIAQRISSFRGADQILVMDKGRIVERGVHEDLLARKGFYHHIWRLQYNAGSGAEWGAEAGNS